MEKIQSITPEQTTYYYLNPILLMRKLSKVKKNIKKNRVGMVRSPYVFTTK